MSLVDSYEADTTRNMLHAFNKSLVVQPLRGAIYHAEFTSTELLVDGMQLIGSFARVDTVRRNSTPLEDIDLVLHQGNQGRYNNGDARLTGRSGTMSLVDLRKCNGWYLQVLVRHESKAKIVRKGSRPPT